LAFFINIIFLPSTDILNILLILKPMSYTKAFFTPFIFGLYIFFGTQLVAQNMVEIGPGNTLPATALYGPVFRSAQYVSNPNARCNMLYTADELARAGIPVGSVITEVAFYKVNTVYTLGSPLKYALFMANSTRTILPVAQRWDSVLITHTMVDTNAAKAILTGAQWVSFPLSTPYAYSGDGLEIATNIYLPSAGTSGVLAWRYSGNQGESAALIVATPSTSLVMDAAVPAYKNRPDIRITFTPPPCSSAPFSGVIKCNKTQVCAGEPFELSLTHYPSGTPQWEIATDSIGPYTPLAGQTGYTMTTSQSQTRWYRCSILCSGVPTITPAVEVQTNGLPFSGTITINDTLPLSSTNFHSLATLIAEMNCRGISGPVTINFASEQPPFNETVNFGSIFGSSPTNQININAFGNTISSSVTPVLSFSGSSYITIDSLHLDINSTVGVGCVISGQSHHITLRNSEIAFVTGSNISATTTAIAVSGSFTNPKTAGNNGSYIRIENNTIQKASEGICMVGATNYTGNTNNTIVNNKFKKLLSYGIYVKDGDSILIKSNDIGEMGQFYSDTYEFRGIAIEKSHSVKILANRIHSSTLAHNTNGYGIYLVDCNNPIGSESEIINNLIYDLKYYSFTGIHANTNNFKGFKIYHNTIQHFVPNYSSGLTSGLYSAVAPDNIRFYNNIIDIRGGGSGQKIGLNMQVVSTGFMSDYNNIFVASTSNNQTGYWNGYRATLSNWITSSGRDSNSYATNPIFLKSASGNFASYALPSDSGGFPLGITTDIDGTIKSLLKPDIGAVEFNIPLCDQATATSIITTSNANTCLNEPFLLSVAVPTNDYLLTYQWQVATSAAGPYTSIINKTNPSETFQQTTSSWYRMAYTCTDSPFFSLPINIATQAGLPLSITIDTAIAESNTNYHSLPSVIEQLRCKGVSGPTVITFAPYHKTFTDTIRFDSIPGVSAVNTITINGNGNTIAHTSSPVVSISNADFITWDSLNVRVDSNEGIGILITLGAENIIIKNSKIDLGTNSTSTNSVGINITHSLFYYPGLKEKYITVQNNEIIGGYYGFASNTSDFSTLQNNVIHEFNACGVLFSGTSISVKSNNIYRGNSISSNDFTGVQISGSAVNVEGNKIHTSGKSTYTAYGIFFSCSSGDIKNNAIYNINHITGKFYGLYASYSGNINILHNTIAYQDGSQNTNDIVGFHADGAPNNITFKNNIISLKGKGSGARTAWDFPTTSTTYQNSYNCVYIFSKIQSYVMRWGSTWTVYGSSTGSLIGVITNANPEFISDTSFIPRAGSDNFGTPLGVLTDLNGMSRSTVNPDIGAIEFTVPVCISPPIAGATLTNISSTCIGKEVRMWFDPNQTTFGIGQTNQWQIAYDSVGPYAPILNATEYSAAVNQSASRWYRVAITCNGVTAYTTPTTVYTDSGGMMPAVTIDTSIARSASNYHSLSEFLTDLYCLGLKSPTTVTFAPHQATFYESIKFSNIIGISDTNTLTIYGNGNTIASSSSTAPIIFEGASYIHLDGLNVLSTAQNTYGIFITGASHHLSIKNASITTSMNSYGGIVASASATSPTSIGNNGTYLTIENNHISGGYYGISLIGSPNYLDCKRHSIKNNLIENFTSYGIYMEHCDSSQINNNNINRSAGVNAGTFYGIYIQASRGLFINANRIHSSGLGLYAATGISFNNCTNITGNETIISNNAIYNIAPAKGSFTGINAISNFSGFRVYHNTILYNLTNIEMYDKISGINLNLVSNVAINNNIIKLGGSGKTTMTCMYVNPLPSGSFSSDRNLFYLDSSSNNYVGFWNGLNRSSLNNWIAASSQDSTSLTIDPGFIADTTITPLPITIDNKGISLGILTDINNAPRATSSPDIGAIEFTGVQYDLKLQSASISHSGACYSANDPLSVVLKNLSDTVNLNTDPFIIRWNVSGPINSSGNMTFNSGLLPSGSVIKVDTMVVDRSTPGVYELSVFIDKGPKNQIADNDSIKGISSIIRPILSVTPKSATLQKRTDSLMLMVTGPSIPGGKIYFSEICQWKGSGAVWPGYLLAGNYVELTGVPNTNLEGYILEEWEGTNLSHRSTLTANTMFSPGGTMIIATGSLNSSLPDPNNFYYHSGNEFVHQPNTNTGYIIRDPIGGIVDAVGYGAYTFPAASGVLPSDWSGFNVNSVYTGIRLTSADNNSSSCWSPTTTSFRQDPNMLNNNLVISLPPTLNGFNWKYQGSYLSDSTRLTVGPFLNSGVYPYVASYSSVCGTYYDTAYISVSTPLPVELIVFSAKAHYENALLYWKTASEINHRSFEIQRSSDGITFTRIAELKGLGDNGSYFYEDVDASQNGLLLYYRLNQVDDNGQGNVSQIRQVNFNPLPEGTLKLMPNPFSTNLFLSIEGIPKSTLFTIRVTDLQGRLLLNRHEIADSDKISIDEAANLENGFYLIQVIYNDKVFTGKVVKN
jgi:hypothetical protein